MFSHMLLMYTPHMPWLYIFFGVNIHILAICKYLLTNTYTYIVCKNLLKKKIKTPSILFFHKKLMFEIN